MFWRIMFRLPVLIIIRYNVKNKPTDGLPTYKKFYLILCQHEEFEHVVTVYKNYTIVHSYLREHPAAKL